MEILGVKKWIVQCLNSVFSAIGLDSGKKNARFRPLSLFFTIVLQIFPVCSPGRDQLLERADRKISALVSAPVSALYMTFGSQGWTALFDLVDTLGPKV